MTPERFAGLTGRELRLLALVCAIVMLRMAGLFMLLPVLAPYAQGLPGGDLLLAGLAVGGYGLTQALLGIPLGWLSDRWGRGPILVLGLGLFVAGSIWAAVAADAAQLVAARLLQGAGAVSGVLTATLADGVREHRRTRAMAFLGISIALSFILSLALGPWLAASQGVPAVFAAIAAAGVLAVVAVARMPGGAGHAPGLDEVLAALARPGMVTGVASAGLLHAMLTALFVVLPFQLQDLGLGAGAHWWLYLAVLLASVPGTVLLVRWGEGRALAGLAAGFLLVGAGLGGLSADPPGLVPLIVVGAVFFAGFNFVEARLPSRVSEIAPGGARGAAMGLYATGQFLGAFLGGGLAGALAGLGRGAGLSLLAALALLWSVVLLLASRGEMARSSS